MNNMYRHETAIEVRGYELDSFGHVNNSVYLNYIEEARWQFCREKILLNNQGKYVFKEGIFFIVVETNIKYISELINFDKIKIESFYECDGDFIIADYIINNFYNNKKVAVAKSKMVCVDKARLVHSIPQYVKNILS